MTPFNSEPGLVPQESSLNDLIDKANRDHEIMESMKAARRESLITPEKVQAEIQSRIEAGQTASIVHQQQTLPKPPSLRAGVEAIKQMAHAGQLQEVIILANSLLTLVDEIEAQKGSKNE